MWCIDLRRDGRNSVFRNVTVSIFERLLVRLFVFGILIDVDDMQVCFFSQTHNLKYNSKKEKKNISVKYSEIR